MASSVAQPVASQFTAALGAARHCIEMCPDEVWESPIGDATFDQIAFHLLFFTDYYLDDVEESLKEQRFHRENTAFFRDYEELQDRKPIYHYSKADLIRYQEHCRQKAVRVLESETDAKLSGPCGFAGRKLSRLELHLYNMRHIQHHAGQLAMRLRMDANLGVPWVSSGQV